MALTLPTVPVAAPAAPTVDDEAAAYASEIGVRVGQAGLTGPVADCVIAQAMADHAQGVDLTDERALQIIAACRQRLPGS